jgi:uncharacterized repeat protein (TIGR02543 family)
VVSGSGLNCVMTGGSQGGTCAINVAVGGVVTITAAPSAGHSFGGWTDACTGLALSCDVTMSSAKTAFATFLAPGASTFALTLASGGGTGNGTITGGGLTCNIVAATQNGSCSGAIAASTAVVLTATPSAGHTFAGWGGGVCAGLVVTCNVTMSAARSVTAAFTAPGGGGGTFPLTVQSAGGSGSGTITGPGIACNIAGNGQNGSCSNDFANGTVVTLTAAATAGHTFAGWTGACAGAGNNAVCNVTMSAARAVTAAFTAPIPQFALTLGVSNGNGTGTVTGTSINCNFAINGPTATSSGTCSASYNSGTNVSLTATPSADMTFIGWGGACAGTGACNVSMTQARSVTAKFNAPSLATLQASLFNNCVGCHVAGTEMSAGNTHSRLVNVATTSRAGNPLATTYPTRVVPYDAQNSYLYYQLIKTPGAYGMPLAGTVAASLVNQLVAWINGGALAVNP